MPPASALLRVLPAALALVFALALPPARAQDAAGRDFVVVVYNVENLFDADGVAEFDDYKPAGPGNAEGYTPRKLFTKIDNIRTILARFHNGAGPDIILFNEFETDVTPDSTVEDLRAWLGDVAGTTARALLTAPLAREHAGLPAEAWLLKHLEDTGLTGYNVATTPKVADPLGRTIAHSNAVFSKFPITAVRVHPTPGARPILEVTLEVDGAPLTVFVNHWKSGASDPVQEQIRIGNARTLRARLDEIFAADPQADVIVGGDFNSMYNQATVFRSSMRETAVNTVLRSQGNELALRQQGGPDLYNLWFELPSERRQSDWYDGRWGTLMQVLVARGLYDRNGVQYIDNSFGVARVPGLNADTVAGTPLRWTNAGETGGGFSDHFPIFAWFRTVPDGRRDQWIALQRPGTQQTEGTEQHRVFASADFRNATRIESLPAGERLQVPANSGRIFDVTATVTAERPFTVRVRDEDFLIWSFDRDFRIQIYSRFKVGDTMRFYGQMGQHRGAWQFVLHEPTWLR